MELKFENRFYSDDKIMSEYVHKVLCRRLYVLGTLVIIGSLIAMAFAWLNNNYIMTAVYAVCLFISSFVVITVPHLTLKQLKDAEKRLHNGKNQETIVQFGDKIAMTEGTFSLAMEYSQIIKIYSLRHSYVLMFSRSNGIILSPENFSIGTFEDFQAFIKSMCPNAKLI